MFKLEIATDNAAFTDDPDIEIARILRELAETLETSGGRYGSVRDINGNKVGEYDMIAD